MTFCVFVGCLHLEKEKTLETRINLEYKYLEKNSFFGIRLLLIFIKRLFY